MGIKVIEERCTGCGLCLEVCPFAAMELRDGVVTINEACRVCRLCLKACPESALELRESSGPSLDRDAFQGVMVVGEQQQQHLHPVTFELMGKGRELADQLGQQLHVVLIGQDLTSHGERLLEFGADRVWLADAPELQHFLVEPYANAVAEAVHRVQPNILLLAATNAGRSLAPRLAVRLRTGLTADCTYLHVKDNGDLVQIRPAFGGNVMAQIVTPKHRPQMATVRYKMMEPARPQRRPGASVEPIPLHSDQLRSGVTIHSVKTRKEQPSISEAEVVIAVGRGLKAQKDLQLASDLAELLGGQVGVTRPLVEMGWADHNQQIGLSGRSIRPKLLICFGISGAVQFNAGAASADWIVAINEDPDAAVFQIAHYGLVGDLYEIVPRLIHGLRERRAQHAVF